MPFSRRLSGGWLAAFLLSVGLISPSFADLENNPIHFSGDKQLWDRRTNEVELFGHAAVTQVGETLTGDYIYLDLDSRDLDCRGNCVYITGGTNGNITYGDEMHFNLNTRTGTVTGARVATDKYTLRGERLYKRGEGRYQTHWGEYTTCQDCASSWSLLAEDVDMQVNGYAYMSNVTAKIKDSPIFWIPYLIVPIKSGRQSGFLFPTFALGGNNGTTVVVPYFWAINRSSDMTFGAGQYFARGTRLDWEGRYALAPRSNGIGTAHFTYDKTFPDVPNRWSFNLGLTHEFPGGIDGKLRLAEVSDNIYPFIFPADVPTAAGEAFLGSSLSFSKGSSSISTYVSLQRYRNLLNSNPNGQLAQLTEFDPKTVQVAPTIVVTANDTPLWGSPVIVGFSGGLTNFTRSAGPFDYNVTYPRPGLPSGLPFGSPVPPNLPFVPGVDPIRKATRLYYTPTVYTTLRPFDTFSLVPSLEYRGYFYYFGNLVPNLSRGYFLFQVDLTTQLERIYEFPDNADFPRAKHLIRPLLTYSFIPPFSREIQNHPFQRQIQYALNNGYFGFNFDDNDIIPITYTPTSANYFVPLGNSLAYGFTSQWIRRKGKVEIQNPTYQNSIELSAGQAINFLEITNPLNPGDPHVFTRFFSALNINYDRFSSSTTYYYYPDVSPVQNRSTISTGATWVFERGYHQRVLMFDRSITLGYAYNQINSETSNITGTLNFSISDYILPSLSVSYGFQTDTLYGVNFGLTLQSPSQCWKLTTGVSYAPGTSVVYPFNLGLNLSGSGF